MSKAVAFCLDDGHGMETSYKASPITGMPENDFNRNVVRHIIEYCKANNIIYIETAKGDTDTPLAKRTAEANLWYEQLKKQYSDLYCIFISCHANAGGGTGSEIWVHSKAEALTVAAAQSVLDEIVKLGLKKRGVKKGFVGDANADFHVNRETNMVSMLIEYAFMDNPADAQLLLRDDFRKNCAKATVIGMLNYLNLPFIDIGQEKPSDNGEELSKLKEENTRLKTELQSLNNALAQKEGIINKIKVLVG